MPALRRPEQLRQALAAVATRPEWNDYKEDSDEGERWRTDTDSWVASWALFATRVLSCWAADARHRWLPTRNNVNEAVVCRPAEAGLGTSPDGSVSSTVEPQQQAVG